MTAEPRHNFCRCRGLLSWRHCRAVDHQDRQSEAARGRNLCECRRTSRVFGNDKVDAVILNQAPVRVFGKWATVHDHMGVGQGQRPRRRIDQAQQIEMLRVRREIRQMHSPHCQHHSQRRTIQRRDGSGNVRNGFPSIFGSCAPGRAGQCDQGHAGPPAGGNSVAAHLSGKGVRCIDDMRDLMRLQIVMQAGHASKAPHTLWQRLALGSFDTTGKGHRSPKARFCGRSGKGRRFGGAAKDQKVGCDG